MKKIVVVGGGTMGLDIAHTFARSGHAVVVREISDELAEKSHSRLVAALDKLVARGKMDEAKRAEILGNMTFTTDLAAAADADLVLEAIVENLDVKKSLFQELDGICKADTIFATNTSSISITAIAAATQRADRFIGMHFFNPATVMKLVEVIRGVHTSQETYDAICQLSADIGKEAVEVAEAPGFVVNKILIPMINEAIGLVETGVATPGAPWPWATWWAWTSAWPSWIPCMPRPTTPSTVPPCCCGRWSVEACWAVRPARVSTITPSKRPADKNVGKESFPPRRFSIFLCSSCTRCAPASTRRPAAPSRPASGAGPPPPGPLSGCHTASPSALRRPPGTQGPEQWRYMSHIDLQN